MIAEHPETTLFPLCRWRTAEDEAAEAEAWRESDGMDTLSSRMVTFIRERKASTC